MTRVSLAAVAVLVLAAGCSEGGAGKEAWIKQCAKGGDDRKTCTCVADDLQKNLDHQAFKAMLLDAEGKPEEANRIRDKMPVDSSKEAGQVAAGSPGSPPPCGKCA